MISSDVTSPTPVPSGGWLSVEHGIIHLHGDPPASDTISLAFKVASTLRPRQTQHRASRLVPQPPRSATDVACRRHRSLLRLVRTHEPGAWRLLEVTGILRRALPEIAEAMSRKRADINDLDPLAAMRFQVAERLDDLAVEIGHPSDDLVLAALAVDVCRDTTDSPPCWLALLDRLVAVGRCRGESQRSLPTPIVARLG